MWLRPTVCLAMVAALCIRSVFDKTALETLLSSHVLGQVSIAIVAVAFYIPLSIHEYRYGRWATSQPIWKPWGLITASTLLLKSCDAEGGRKDIVQVRKFLCSPHELQVYSFCHSWQPKVYHDKSSSGQSFSLDNRLKRRAQRVRRNTRYCTISFEFGQDRYMHTMYAIRIWAILQRLFFLLHVVRIFQLSLACFFDPGEPAIAK